MPVFANQLKKLDYGNPKAALREMANHIKYIQEQLEYTLMNLDSRNVREIETDVTEIVSSGGEASFSGTSITLSGKNGEVFKAGLETDGNFSFYVKGKGGAQAIYLSSNGLVIPKAANISIDCGEW